MVCSPHLDAETIESHINDIVTREFNDDFYKAIMNKNKASRLAFEENLLTYLQSTSTAYQDTRAKNSRNIRAIEKELKPLVGDVVIYLDSKDNKKFGVITSVDSLQLVTIKCLHHKTQIEKQIHIRLLSLLFRPTEWNSGIPVAKLLPVTNTDANCASSL